MIQVDISNIWGSASLPDLLALEAEVSLAHRTLSTDSETGENVLRRMYEGAAAAAGELGKIHSAAELIREDSEVLVVVEGSGCTGAGAVIELLQGRDRNLHRGKGDPQILFVGRGITGRRWAELVKNLEGKEFSLCVIGCGEMAPEAELAFRELKWLLERRFGTDEARSRIYAVAGGEESRLEKQAMEEGWHCFPAPDNGFGEFSVLSAAGLLPMAAAGIDVEQLLKGAARGKEAFDLRSYENPVWLYAACRNLLHRKGGCAELLVCPEGDFAGMGAWWQKIFARGDRELFPVFSAGNLSSLAAENGGKLFVTLLRFEQAQPAGSTEENLDTMAESAFREALDCWAEMGTGVICVDCAQPNAAAVGELLCFFQLSGVISGSLMQTASAR